MNLKLSPPTWKSSLGTVLFWVINFPNQCLPYEHLSVYIYHVLTLTGLRSDARRFISYYFHEYECLSVSFFICAYSTSIRGLVAILIGVNIICLYIHKDFLHLTHWGRATHICVSKLTIIGSDNGLSPGRRQAIIWTIVGILLIGTSGTNFNEILSETHTFSFKNISLKTPSAKWRPFCLGLNELILLLPPLLENIFFQSRLLFHFHV